MTEAVKCMRELYKDVLVKDGKRPPKKKAETAVVFTLSELPPPIPLVRVPVRAVPALTSVPASDPVSAPTPVFSISTPAPAPTPVAIPTPAPQALPRQANHVSEAGYQLARLSCGLPPLVLDNTDGAILFGVWELAETLNAPYDDAASLFMEWVDRFLRDPTSSDKSPGSLYGAMHRYTSTRPADNSQWTRALLANSYELLR